MFVAKKRKDLNFFWAYLHLNREFNLSRGFVSWLQLFMSSNDQIISGFSPANTNEYFWHSFGYLCWLCLNENVVVNRTNHFTHRLSMNILWGHQWMCSCVFLTSRSYRAIHFTNGIAFKIFNRSRLVEVRLWQRVFTCWGFSHISYLRILMTDLICGFHHKTTRFFLYIHNADLTIILF